MENNKQITAIEWLESEIEKQIFQCETEWQCGYQKALNEVVFLLRQTKEMEKQQIIDAFDEGQEYEYQYHINSAPKFDSLTYYNKTFKSE